MAAKKQTKKAGKKAPARKSWNARDLPWDTVDWSKTNVEIAEELGCAMASVHAAREARGIEQHPVGRPKGVGDGGTVAEPTASRGVRLPVRLWDDLDAAAQEDETSTPRLVRTVLEEWVAGRSRQ